MNPVKTVSGVLIHPVHTAASVTGRAIGLSYGLTKASVRTTGRIIEWAVDRGMTSPQGAPRPAPGSTPSAPQGTSVTVPGSVPGSAAGSATEVTDTLAVTDTPAVTETPAVTDTTTVTDAPAVTDAPTDQPVPTPAEVKPAIDRAEPLEAEPVADEVLTASGIPAADVGVNPATGMPNDYDTEPEPLLDPGTVKSVRSESDVMSKAADADKG